MRCTNYIRKHNLHAGPSAAMHNIKIVIVVFSSTYINQVRTGRIDYYNTLN